MGNSLCCPTSNPCDHTVDETQGLLNSPDSKVSARPLTTDGISQPLEVEESKNEDKQEKAVISSQPMAAPKLAEGSVQSSYGSVIQMLHTDVSLAAQTSQSASPVSKVSHEPEDAATTATETKKDDETTKEIQTSAPEDADTLPVNAPTELATATVKEETQAQLPDALEQEDEAGKPELMVQEATAKTPADEPHAVQVDTQKEVTEEDTVMRSAEMDKSSAEESNNKREAGEVDTEEDELKTPVEVLPATDTLGTKELVLSDFTGDGLESKRLLTQVNVAENSVNLIPDNSSPEHSPSLSQPSCEVEETALPIEKAVAGTGLEIHEEDVGVKEDSLPRKTQETSEQESSLSRNISEESTVNYVENGQVDALTDEKPAEVDVEKPLLDEGLQKPCEEPSHTENQEIMHEPPTNSNSVSFAEELEKPEPTDTTEVQETITECVETEGDIQQALQNGLLAHGPVEKAHSPEEPDEQVDENEPESKDSGPSETFSLEHVFTDEREPAPQACESDETTAGDESENAGSTQGQKREIVLSSSPDIKVALIAVSDIENIAEKDEHKDADLYRGDEEMDQEQDKETKSVPLLELTIPGVEEKCSLDAPVDILEYSEREWKGNTSKSNLIRKGYSDISCSFTGLRRVRGDNYCSLRATLYQVLATTTHTPDWLLEDDFTSLPEKIEAEEQLIGMWVFPHQCVKAGENEDAVEKLKHYLGLLQKRWQAAAECESLEEKQAVCNHVFQGGEEEYALLEVLKFLMLVKAVEFRNRMQTEQEVPVFCWLLFARDTSENLKMFFSNHLSQVGFSGGLEQVEMFLLGYALQHTIQAFRLYKTDTEEFVTHYPDDHKQDWPCVCIVTEDDRHYNVPVRKPTQFRE